MEYVFFQTKLVTRIYIKESSKSVRVDIPKENRQEASTKDIQMAKINMTRYSTSLIMEERQTKIRMFFIEK
jgi:hypothetical protein